MKSAEIAGIGVFTGEEVTLCGWVYNLRSSGKILFLQVRDGTGIIQCIVERAAVGEEKFAEAATLTQESSLTVTGTVREDARAPGGYELSVSALEIIQVADGFPITPKEHGSTFLMDNRHLWLRSRRQHAILKIRAGLVRFIREFFDNRGFVLCDTPVFTPSACEGTTTLFETDYFGDKAYLTQSGQLYNEANAMALGRVYCFGPTFRAEKSKTRRHLTEFWMVEPEMAWATLEDVMELGEALILAIVERVLARRRRELDVLGRDVGRLEAIKAPFPRMSYDEAVAVLKKEGLPFEWGGDFGGTDETVLARTYDRPVLVHRFPSAIKAFYMKPDPERPELALGVDFLAPEGYGEIIGGGERLADLDLLLQRIKEHDLPKEAFEWYLDLRRYGSVPHGGFGMGIERLVAWICALPHIRETIPFPRMLYRLRP